MDLLYIKSQFVILIENYITYSLLTKIQVKLILQYIRDK